MASVSSMYVLMNAHSTAPVKSLCRRALTASSQSDDGCASWLEVKMYTLQLPCCSSGTGTGYAAASGGTVPGHSSGPPHPIQVCQDQPIEKWYITVIQFKVQTTILLCICLIDNSKMAKYDIPLLHLQVVSSKHQFSVLICQ